MKDSQKNFLIKPLIVLFIALFSVISCRGEDDTEDVTPLVGNWEWVSSIGGVGNTTETPTSTGNNIVFNFGADKKYTITTNGTVTNEGTFSLYKNVSNLEHLDRLYIDFSNAPDKMIVNNEEKTLILSDDVNDGYTYTYKKK